MAKWKEPLQLEVGKFYRDENNNKIGPLRNFGDGCFDVSDRGPHRELVYQSNGYALGDANLVAEWDDEGTGCPNCGSGGDFHHPNCPTGSPVSTEGRKDDGEKPRYDLIPPEWLDGPAQVLTFGAAKYEPRNWEKGMRWGRCFAALMRHLWAWWRREEKDPETGYSHLWHAACCLMFLMAYEQRGTGEDDRP